MRMRTFLPLLMAPLAWPGAAAAETGVCANAVDRIGCLMASVDAAFERHVRPAKSNSSISVAMARQARDLALSTSYCSAETATASTPLCDLTRADSFAAYQEVLLNDTVARADKIRALDASRTAEQIAIIAASAIEYQPQLETAHRVWIKDALVAAAKERVRRFAMQQNELTKLSMARIDAELDRQREARMSPCNVSNDTRQRCVEQYQRNHMEQRVAALDVATGSVVGLRPVKAHRDITAVLEQCRSAGYSSSGCNVNGADLAYHATRATHVASIVEVCRAAGYSASGCRFDAVDQNFVVAGVLAADRAHMASGSRASVTVIASFDPCRTVGYSQFNCRVEPREQLLIAEANPSSNANSAREIARGAYMLPPANTPSIETGAISVPQLQSPPAFIEPNNGLREISDDGCDLSGKPFGPLHFARGVVIDHEMHDELDRLATLAKSCPGMRIEIHGFSDRTGASAAVQTSQDRAQAVADYLIDKGLAPGRLAAVGRSTGAKYNALRHRGQTIRFADDRRVEFVIRDPSMDEVARRIMWELADLLDPTYIPPVAGLSP
ncbi:OmpA family protein [Hyphomicrobium sp. D-2]|uniref:OmpA family protein n=1 Tax=Hyphomicrobium sp. D-2 TaxID=3041621 RepID=UPI002458DDBF|nr:OmpA family protein [Hyphomicrobium sp. D-2]MDH4983808.1 OmpA family protein [Hyphomicrobium sp. D-2]